MNIALEFIKIFEIHISNIKPQQADMVYRKMAIQTTVDKLGSWMTSVKSNVSTDPAPDI